MGHGILGLVALGTALLLAAPSLLRRVRGFTRAPGFGIAVWVAAAAAGLVTLVALPVVVVIHLPGVGHDVAHLYSSCLHIFTNPADLNGRAGLVLAAAVVGLAPAGWTTWCIGLALAGGRRKRRRHLRLATLVAAQIDGDTLVIDDERPAIYCIAGRPGHIIVTRGAISRLTNDELAAARAHERAHLHGGHHLLLSLIDGIVRATPGLGLFRTARAEVHRLAELAADDIAARTHPREVLADALGAAAHDTADYRDTVSRATRLRRSPITLSRPAKITVGVAAAVLAAAPLSMTAATVANHVVACHDHPVESHGAR